jgi:multisubunit Na+/H+ antiporter MnhF subunit
MELKNILNSLYRSLYWTTGVYALTAFHHYYGSIVYGTPWRQHVVFIGAITLLVCFLLTWFYRRYHNRWLLNSYLIIAMVVFGLAIGLFEGFYNHVIKNILYLSGINRDIWRSLFPAPAYEVPDNFLFEGSGILQFVVGAAQLYALFNLYKTYKN